ncbi:MAG: hypothetical protein Q9160_006399 [Pyrenula sp. 1 TL-2023]
MVPGFFYFEGLVKRGIALKAHLNSDQFVKSAPFVVPQKESRSQAADNMRKAHCKAASVLKRRIHTQRPVKESREQAKVITASSGQYWRTLSITLGFFIAGTALAIGHHFFYHNLNGTTVPANVDENWDLSFQQWKLRIGTGLAFLVKVCFTISVETAYTQLVWAHVRARNRSSSSLDALFAGTTDPSVYFNIEYLTRSRFVSLVASICWLLPLVVTITPATLNVVAPQNVTTAWAKVPIVALNRNESASIDAQWRQVSGNDVSPALYRIISTTATAGRILPMDLMFPYSTYNVSLQLPSLRCKIADVWTNLALDRAYEYTGRMTWRYTQESYTETFRQELGREFEGTCVPLYVAFTPLSRWFVKAISSESEGLGQNQTDPWLDFVQNCLLGDSPGCALGPLTIASDALYQPLWLGLLDQRLVCSLQKTVFNITMTSDGSVQNVVGMPSFERLGSYDEYDITNSEQLICSSFCRTLVTILRGIIAQCPGAPPAPPSASNMFSNTAILSTEMSSVVSEAISNFSPYVDLAPAQENSTNKTLGEMVEELSRNLSVSLFNDRRFWGNESEWPLANVSTVRPVNRYRYTYQYLIMTYIFGFVFSFFGVILGLLALRNNRSSYTTSFSSIMTATRNADLDRLVPADNAQIDVNKTKALKTTKLRFGKLNDCAARPDGSHTTRVGFGLPDEVVPLGKKSWWH